MTQVFTVSFHSSNISVIFPGHEDGVLLGRSAPTNLKLIYTEA